MENEELIRKKNSKKKKYKNLKAGIGVLSVLCIVLAALCVVGGISLANTSGRVSELNSQIETSNKELEDLKTITEQLTNENAALSGSKTELESQIAALTAEKEELSTTLAATAAELEALKNDLTVNGESIDELEKQISEKDKTISSLNTKIKNLNNQISQLNEQIKALQGTTGPEEDEPIDQPSTDTGKYAYLTFDDGISAYTNSILDVLKEYNVKATFFVNWKPWVSGSTDIYKRIINEGHTLANHTATHDFDTVYGSIEGFEKEVMTLHNNIKELTGYEMTIFRFPGGSNASYSKKLGTKLHSKIHELGYEYYDWNIDSGDTSRSIDPDGDGHNVPADILVKRTLNGATSKNAIILMHDLGSYKKTTIEALPEIIEGLIAKGYTLKAMDDSVTPVQFTKDPNQ